MKRVNVKKENKPFKTLAIATIAGLSIIGIGQAQAATLDDIDLSQKQINTPTLDYCIFQSILGLAVSLRLLAERCRKLGFFLSEVC